MADLGSTVQPKSDQLNADDLIGGNQIITVTGVTVRLGEQPVDIFSAEHPDRPYRPSKSMRRVLIAAWGRESDSWPQGARIELYRDPSVKFGGEAVGGIKIGGLSGISKPVRMPLTETRGKRAMHVVQPLPAASQPAPVTPDEVTACTTEEELRALYKATSDEAIRALIMARVEELRATKAEA